MSGQLPGMRHSDWPHAVVAARASARLLRRRFRVYRTTCGCWDWMPADEWGRWQVDAEAATLAATSPYRTIRLGREVLGGKGDASRPIGWATDTTVTIRIDDGLGGFYEQP